MKDSGHRRAQAKAEFLDVAIFGEIKFSPYNSNTYSIGFFFVSMMRVCASN